MFFHSGPYGQNIRVKYYIIWIEVYFFHKEVVCSGADCNLGFCFCCLVKKKNSDVKVIRSTKYKYKACQKSFTIKLAQEYGIRLNIISIRIQIHRRFFIYFFTKNTTNTPPSFRVLIQ